MALRPIPQPCEPIQLGEFFLEDRRFPAVYFLYYRGEVVYVGQSRTLKSRIDQHLTDAVKAFDAVSFTRCPLNRLTQVESYYIKKLAPKHNACGAAKKSRDRKDWGTLATSRRDMRRGRFASPPYKPGEKIETIDASEVFIQSHEMGEFLQVTDRDAGKLTAGLTDNSLMGVLLHVGQQSQGLSKAQDYFEDL